MLGQYIFQIPSNICVYLQAFLNRTWGRTPSNRKLFVCTMFLDFKSGYKEDEDYLFCKESHGKDEVYKLILRKFLLDT